MTTPDSADALTLSSVFVASPCAWSLGMEILDVACAWPALSLSTSAVAVSIVTVVVL